MMSFFCGRQGKFLAAKIVILLSLLPGCSSDHDSDDTENTSTNAGPLVTEVSGGRGRPAGGLRYDISEFDYVEREYFFEGTAKTFPPAAESQADYRSRMIVWTPKDPTRFNGTTFVEWAHVSVGEFELTYDIKALSPVLREQGYAFVLVSAQKTGVCNEGPDGCPASSLKGADPKRYGSLDHPGDDYSFDIFNQAVDAIKSPSGTAPLGSLATRFVIAGGFQMMRDRMDTLDNPNKDTPPFGVAGPLNAYLANGAADAGLVDALLIDSAAPIVEPTRYAIPTIHVLDESAVRPLAATISPNHVTWEVIGAPHLDQLAASHVVTPSPGELLPLLNREEEEARWMNFENLGLAPGTVAQQCATQFPRHFAMNAALAALHDWLETGVPAPQSPFVQRAEYPPTSPTTSLSRDGDGNAIGGYRLPIIQVPAAAYNGEDCLVTGTMSPFSPERLAELYATHQSYVEQLRTATDDAVANRYLLCRDAETIMRKASESTIGGNDTFNAEPSCVE